MSREETTNWFGNYAVKFAGAPDLSSCYAQVSSTGQDSQSGCSAAAGQAQQLRLMFRMFDMEMYVVNSLLAQTFQPTSNCLKSSNTIPSPVTPANPPPVYVPVTPANPQPVPKPATPTNPNPPAFRLLPLPHLPPLPSMPPVPFLEATACPHDNWTMPEYKCYWRVVNPVTKVATIFGLIAARRYGTDMTLWEGLQGRGDPYRILLRESITSFSKLLQQPPISLPFTWCYPTYELGIDGLSSECSSYRLAV